MTGNGMSVMLDRLIRMYESRDLAVRVGLNPYHCSNHRDAPFAAFYDGGRLIKAGGGLSLQELYFFECLAKAFDPRNIFVIGNAFGWSTIALSLIFPRARVVAIDNATEGAEANRGLDLTNEIAAAEGLNCRVILAESPGDVAPVASRECEGGVELALIDGLHTPQQQATDYQAVKSTLAASSLLLFHDVVNFDLIDSFNHIAEDWGEHSQLLGRTPSGMGICYSSSLCDTVGRVANVFSERMLDHLCPRRG
jgi:hypothetical protein